MSSPFLRAQEFESRYNLQRLRYMLQQAEEALKDFRPETIDWAKSALETICKAILDERGVTYRDGDGKFFELPKLIKKTCVTLGAKNEQLVGNITGLAQAIAEMRNKETMAGHGLEGDRPFLSRTEITIFVSTFANLVQILLSLLEASGVDLVRTKLSFDVVEADLELAAFNEELDMRIPVMLGEGDGNIYVGGKEFRPSFLMFHYDRSAYLQELKASRDRCMKDTIENLKPIVSDGVAAHFLRCGYGMDDFLVKEIAISQISLQRGRALTEGSVAASVEPEADGTFKREAFLLFSAEVDISAGQDAMRLRSLKIKDGT